MQADSVALAALKPRLEALAGILDNVQFGLPTSGRDEAERVRTAVVRTINEYLLPRLEEPDAPVVAAVIGSSGTGKSTVVNSLANDRISEVGPLRPTTRNPVLWAHRDHGGRYWSAFVARVRDRVGPTVEVVIGDDELTKQLTLIDTPPAEYVTPAGRNPAVDALALADLCVFVTSPSRYADISAWEFLREIRWRGVPMLFVLNRLPSDRDEAVALLNDFAARLHGNGLLLEPDAAMVFGVSEAVGDRWHGGLDPTSVGALRNELGAVSNTGYRNTLIAMTAFTTGRNVVDRCGLLLEEFAQVEAASSVLDSHVSAAYGSQVDEIVGMLVAGDLADMARHRTWSEAAVDLTAIITRRAGVAAQETASSWMEHDSGAVLLEGEGTSLWRHTEDTSWDVQGRLEGWEETLAEVAARHTKSGSLRPRAAQRLAAKAWRAVVDLETRPPWSVRRRFKDRLDAFRSDAHASLGVVIAGALEDDASRFRSHLRTDEETVRSLTGHMEAITALLQGDQPQLEPVPDAGAAEEDAEEDVESSADA
ncbi:MAG: GTPase domain-containing protein [Acidimicrobiia bacterium]|nr:GTPase domain-containing protein [Acidimicrobiia bacterium]